jgi:hypothetical protein
MAKLMAHNSLAGTVNWPIDHHKRLVWVLDHEVSHVERCGHKSYSGPYFEYGELITLQVVIVVLIIQQLVRSASCPCHQSLVQGWVSVKLEILKQGQLIWDFIDELQWCHVEDTDCSPICTKEDLIIRSRPDNSEVDKVSVDCADKISFLVKNQDFPVVPQYQQIACHLWHNALLNILFNMNFLKKLSVPGLVLPDFNAVLF